MITAVIIDDEPMALAMLKNDLQKYCPQIDLVGTANTFASAYQLLNTNKPDIVFLDIELNDPDGGGIELLGLFPKEQFVVIFYTGWDKYVQSSYQLNAAYFIKKPISIEVLKNAVEKATQKVQSKQQAPPFYRLVSSKGVEFIQYKDIMRLEADGAVTHIHTLDNERKTSSESLGEIEKKLPKQFFYRIHRSHIVHKQQVKAVQKDGIVVLAAQINIPISSKNMNEFIAWLEQV